MRRTSAALEIEMAFPSKGRAADDAFLKRLRNRRRTTTGTSLGVISNDAVQSGTGLIQIDGSNFIQVDGSNFVEVD